MNLIYSLWLQKLQKQFIKLDTKLFDKAIILRPTVIFLPSQTIKILVII